MKGIAFTADRRRIDRLVEQAQILMDQTQALSAVVRSDVLSAHQMVQDAATEYRRAVLARVTALEQRVSVLTAAEQAALATAVSLVAEFEAGASADDSVTVTNVP